MATRFLDKSTEAAAEYTGSHCGIGFDSDDNVLRINPDGTKRTVVTTEATQTLTGKTVSGPAPVEVVTATNVIAASESGATFFLNSATEFVSTLPAPAAGLVFDFIVKAAPSGASYTVVTASSANVLMGHILTCQDAGGTSDSETSGGDTYSFVDGKAVVGDRARFISDGTNWYVTGFAKVYDGATITTAS